MNFKDLTNAVAQTNNIPAGRVRVVAKAFLEQLESALDSGEHVNLPGLAFKTKSIPAREADGDKPGRSEGKRLVVKRRVNKNSDSADTDSVEA